MTPAEPPQEGADLVAEDAQDPPASLKLGGSPIGGLDVAAATLGAAAGICLLTLLSATSERLREIILWSEDLGAVVAVPLAILAVRAKRRVLPTPPRERGGNLLLRVVYLLSIVFSTLALALATWGFVGRLPRFLDDGFAPIWAMLWPLLVIGGGLAALAAFIDVFFLLRRPPPAPER